MALVFNATRAWLYGSGVHIREGLAKPRAEWGNPRVVGEHVDAHAQPYCNHGVEEAYYTAR